MIAAGTKDSRQSQWLFLRRGVQRARPACIFKHKHRVCVAQPLVCVAFHASSRRPAARHAASRAPAARRAGACCTCTRGLQCGSPPVIRESRILEMQNSQNKFVIAVARRQRWLHSSHHMTARDQNKMWIGLWVTRATKCKEIVTLQEGLGPARLHMISCLPTV